MLHGQKYRFITIITGFFYKKAVDFLFRTNDGKLFNFH